MANKVIQFTVSADGGISPKVEQAAGVQGSHNVTEVEFDVSGLSYTFTNEDIKVRIQMIDGAGGFDSTGFLTVKDNKVSTLLPRRFTNAGGVAKVYLVVTEITYDDGVAHGIVEGIKDIGGYGIEKISEGFKNLFHHSAL